MKEIANAHVTATVYHSLLDLEKSTDNKVEASEPAQVEVKAQEEVKDVAEEP